MICKTNKTAFAAIRSELGNTYSQAPATYTALDAASARRTHGASNSTPVTARYHRSTLRASCDTSASIAVGVPALVVGPAVSSASGGLDVSGHARCQYPSSPRFV